MPSHPYSHLFLNIAGTDCDQTHRRVDIEHEYERSVEHCI